MRKVAGKLSLFAGSIIILVGVVTWVKNGMPLENLLPTKNLFGTNPLHMALFGVLLFAYGLFEEAKNRNSEKGNESHLE